MLAFELTGDGQLPPVRRDEEGRRLSVRLAERKDGSSPVFCTSLKDRHPVALISDRSISAGVVVQLIGGVFPARTGIEVGIYPASDPGIASQESISDHGEGSVRWSKVQVVDSIELIDSRVRDTYSLSHEASELLSYWVEPQNAVDTMDTSVPSLTMVRHEGLEDLLSVGISPRISKEEKFFFLETQIPVSRF